MPDRISRELMYWRVAAELPPGGVVGLGPSLPQSIPGYVPSDLGRGLSVRERVNRSGKRSPVTGKDARTVGGRCRRTGAGRNGCHTHRGVRSGSQAGGWKLRL